MSETALQEQLLDAWLRLSSVISNERLVYGFSFHEAQVLNLLYKQYESGEERKLTATDLCRRTGILKSQMNSILTSLERQGMILRERSGQDRRQILVEMNRERLGDYFQCHARHLQLAEGLLDKISPKEGEQAVAVLNRLADCFSEVLKEKQNI